MLANKPRSGTDQRQPTRRTLLALRHLVHTLSRFGDPSTITLSRWMLGFHRRRERRCEWEMLFPNPGVFPQMSQTEAITATQDTRSRIRGDPSIDG